MVEVDPRRSSFVLASAWRTWELRLVAAEAHAHIRFGRAHERRTLWKGGANLATTAGVTAFSQPRPPSCPA
jgi:hypothetical protein